MKDQLLLLLILLLEHLELLPDRVEAVFDALSSAIDGCFAGCSLASARQALLSIRSAALLQLLLDGIAPKECGRFALGLFFLWLRIECGLITLLFHFYLKVIFLLIIIA